MPWPQWRKCEHAEPLQLTLGERLPVIYIAFTWLFRSLLFLDGLLGRRNMEAGMLISIHKWISGTVLYCCLNPLRQAFWELARHTILIAVASGRMND